MGLKLLRFARDWANHIGRGQRPRGFSGGIWLIWDDEEVRVRLSYVHKSFLHAEITSAGGGDG